MKRKLKPLHLLLIAVGLLLIAAIVAKKAGWIGGESLENVTVEKAELRDIVETVIANGKVQPETEVKISSEISGEIIGLYVKEGDSVKKGQLLVRINPQIIEAALERAEAAVNNAKASKANAAARLKQAEANFKNISLNYNRNKKLFEQKVISDAEFDAAKAQYETSVQEIESARQSVAAAEFTINSASAGVKETRENLLRTTIYSPMEGIVTKLNVELGERVVGTAQMAGTEMMRVANLNAMMAKVDVSEADIVRISVGDTADIEVDAYPGRFFKGIVTEVSNSANSSGGIAAASDQVTNFAVKIHLLNSSYEDLLKKKKVPFRPGMSASVEIHTDRVSGIVAVPIQAVTIRSFNSKGEMSLLKKTEDSSDEETDSESSESSKSGDKLTNHEVVFVVENGISKAQKVTVGIQDDAWIAITSGIKAGQEVISGPYSSISKKLDNKTKVKVVSRKALYSKDK